MASSTRMEPDNPETTEELRLHKIDAQQAFVNRLARERDSPTADFEIVCKDTSFKVHRVIVGMHSDYFKRMCEGEFVESRLSKVHLRGDSVAAVKAMIDWMYAFDYSRLSL